MVSVKRVLFSPAQGYRRVREREGQKGTEGEKESGGEGWIERERSFQSARKTHGF